MKKTSKKKSETPKTEEKNGKGKFKYLTVGGVRYRTTYNKKFENRKKHIKPDLNKISSFIPGTIIKLMVKEGQKCKAGDNLMVLEAMKMYNRITLPVDAKITKINVNEGDKVPKGTVMIEFEHQS
jgi:biotin carboxyl carrier protein